MNRKAIFILTLSVLLISTVVIAGQVFAREVTCSGAIQRTKTGNWSYPRSTSDQVSCFSFYFRGGKYMSVSLISETGKFNLYLEQGENSNRLDQRITRGVIYSKGVLKTSVLKDLPAGYYVVAAEQVGAKNSFQLRVDEVNTSTALTPINSECSQKSENCRFVNDLRRAAVFLGSDAGSTATLPLQISCPGQIIVEAQWTEGPAEMLIEIYGPGMDRPYPPTRSRNPLRVTQNVTRLDISKGSDWYIDLTNFQGGNHDLSLRYETPAPYCIPSGQEYLRKLTLEQGIDRLHGGDYLQVSTKDAIACREVCSQDIRCASFAYSHTEGRCYLKSGVPQPVRDSSCTSGVVAIRVFPLLERTDYNGMDLGSKPANSAEACRQACIADLRCMAFTFNTQTRQCYPKFGIPQPSRCEHCVSGAAIYRQASVELKTDRFGGDYEHRQLLQRDPELCRLACAQDPRCKAYTYSANDGVCHLKDSVPPTSACAHCTSGVVQPRTFSYELNQDRQQSDYFSFENPLNEPEICRLACAQDQRCTTYVYKRPGYQGNTALCFLKAQTPGQVSDNCCISGVAGR